VYSEFGNFKSGLVLLHTKNTDGGKVLLDASIGKSIFRQSFWPGGPYPAFIFLGKDPIISLPLIHLHFTGGKPEIFSVMNEKFLTSIANYVIIGIKNCEPHKIIGESKQI
jgi:hypothetical protein